MTNKGVRVFTFKRCQSCLRIVLTLALFVHKTLTLSALDYSDIQGWGTHDVRPALTLLLRDEEFYTRKGMYESLFEALRAYNLEDMNKDKARALIEAHFEPVRIEATPSNNVITGYYIPTYEASYRQSKIFSVPVYRHPQSKKINHVQSREAIQKGVFQGQGLEIAWLKSELDLFDVQMQGSGFLTFENGDKKLIHFAGHNGHSYGSISNYMIEKGYILEEERSADTVYTFLRENPQLQPEILNKNPSYVYFLFKEPSSVTGAAGLELQAFRSLAVDKRVIPLGSLIFLQTQIPDVNSDGHLKRRFFSKKPKTTAFNQLCIAHDQGGAIKGAGRADLFFGSDKRSPTLASYMHQPGTLIKLRPK